MTDLADHRQVASVNPSSDDGHGSDAVPKVDQEKVPRLRRRQDAKSETVDLLDNVDRRVPRHAAEQRRDVR